MKHKKGIARDVLLLGTVSFLNDLSSEMIMPILPMFIASLGGTGIAIGIIGGARDSITSFLKIISGYISDKTGKKKALIFSGYFLSSVFKILLTLSKTWHHILIFISFERIGKGLRDAPRDAIIAQAMPHQKGRAFGVARAFDTSGAILGAICAFIFFQLLKLDFKTIILIAAACGFLSLIPLTFVHEKKNPQTDTGSFKATIAALPQQLKLFLGIATIFALANFSYMFFIMKAQNLFGKGYAVGLPIALYILFNIFYAVLAIPFGSLSDKIGRKKTLVLGYSLFAITTLSFALFNSLPAYIILFALYGIVNAIIVGNQKALVSDLAHNSAQGTGIGAYHTLTGLAALPASIIAGALWNYAPAAPFMYGAAVSTCAALMLLFTIKKS